MVMAIQQPALLPDMVKSQKARRCRSAKAAKPALASLRKVQLLEILKTSTRDMLLLEKGYQQHNLWLIKHETASKSAIEYRLSELARITKQITKLKAELADITAILESQYELAVTEIIHIGLQAAAEVWIGNETKIETKNRTKGRV